MMQTFPLILILVSGVLCLYIGAQVLVTFASKLALSFGMTKMMTGLTVVAFCTSSPELASSLMAQIQGSYSDIALGNVIGTNISNIALILGSLALIRPLSIHTSAWKVEAPLMIAVTLLLGVVMLFGKITRVMGAIFCALLVFYLIRHIWIKPSKKEEKSQVKKIAWPKKILYFFLIFVGSSALALGGYLVVKAAVVIGTKLGVSERVLGLTVVAIGTSLPEFAASCVALIKNMSDVALGNMFGSNVYNILMVVGIVALVHPISFSSRLLDFDIPILIAFSILVWCLIAFRKRLGRLAGLVLVFSYCGYFYWLVK